MGQKIRLAFVLLLLSVGFCLQFASAQAQSPSGAVAPVVIEAGQTLDHYPLAPHMEYIQDPQRNQVVNALMAQERGWQPSPADGIHVAGNADVYWVRMRLDNRSEDAHTVAVGRFPNNRFTTLYIPQPDGSVETRESGADLPFYTQELDWGEARFFVLLPAQTVTTLFMRVEEHPWWPLDFAPTLTSESVVLHTYSVEESNWQYIQGLYIGIILVMVAYNSFLYFSIRDTAYLYYVLYLVSFGLFAMGNFRHGFRYLWPMLPMWERQSTYWTGALSGIFAILFIKQVLHTKEYTPRIDRLLTFVGYSYTFGLITTVLRLYELSDYLVALSALSLSVLVIATAVIIFRKGYRPARLFLIAWGFFLGGIILLTLVLLGILPDSPITDYAWQIGSALEVTLLSLTLTDRITVLREEKEMAQRDLMASQQRALELSQETERILEAKVRERTFELEQRNTELARSREELAVARDEAVAANRAKSIYLTNMSHELRTPMTAILGYSELMLEEAREQEIDSGFVNDLERIQGAGRHLLALVNSVLDLAKIEAGRMELTLREVEVPTMVESVVSTIRPLIEKNGNHLEIECPEWIGTIRTDETKLRQMLLNLLSNAAKFTERGTVSLRVRRFHQQEQECISFEVRDSGIGIAPEMIGMLFKEFSQASTTVPGKYGGTGLGLAISRRLCQMMGGDITVQSEVGGGSTFTIVLPVQAEPLPVPAMA